MHRTISLALATAATLSLAAPAHAWTLGGAWSSFTNTVGSFFSGGNQYNPYGTTTATITDRYYSQKLGRYVTIVSHVGPTGRTYYNTNGLQGRDTYGHPGVSKGYGMDMRSTD